MRRGSGLAAFFMEIAQRSEVVIPAKAGIHLDLAVACAVAVAVASSLARSAGED